MLLVDTTQVQEGIDVVVVSLRRQELFLSLRIKRQKVVTFAQGQLPPWVFVVVSLSGINCQLKSLFQVVLDVEQVLENESGF